MTCFAVLWIGAAGSLAAAADRAPAFLDPGDYTARVGDSIDLRVQRGDALALRPTAWPRERARWLFVRGGGEQEALTDSLRRGQADDALTIELRHSGVTMIGFDQEPTITRMTGRELSAFLQRYTNALDATDAAAVAPKIAAKAEYRVRRIESAKTLIRVIDPAGKRPDNSAIAQSKSGQQVEIRALADPTRTPVGSDLPLRMYVDGSMQPGVRMRATCVASGVTHETVSDAGGFCVLRITDPGVWRVEFHHAEAGGGGAKFDWTIHSATLTFEVAPEATEGTGGTGE